MNIKSFALSWNFGLSCLFNLVEDLWRDSMNTEEDLIPIHVLRSRIYLFIFKQASLNQNLFKWREKPQLKYPDSTSSACLPQLEDGYHADCWLCPPSHYAYEKSLFATGKKESAAPVPGLTEVRICRLHGQTGSHTLHGKNGLKNWRDLKPSSHDV